MCSLAELALISPKDRQFGERGYKFATRGTQTGDFDWAEIASIASGEAMRTYM